ncbi:hypothetical protein [Methylobrevis pamukkalensis]|uniref:Lipoprotein n=1 Tax=Methylobrevis pamukkalensis TaxID=1439726 RepID=A0A1E3H4Y6_9HYPH|nr:hypothetical protein [Methylobrevis pamukkalensis]ODN71398.1 hypothetical protein A6302_01262 [Methylobrevis pamukkalensis]
MFLSCPNISRTLAIFGLAGLAACSGAKNYIPGAPTPEEEAELRQKFAATAVCPQVGVRDGTQVYTLHARGMEADPAGVRYQANINKTARECRTDASGATTIKVGLAGRLIVGPKGDAGTVNLPLRVAVVRNGNEVLFSQIFPVAAGVSGGAGNSLWTKVVDGIVVPAEKTSGNIEIMVGFDEGAT